MISRTMKVFLSVFLAAAVAVLSIPAPVQAVIYYYGPDLGGWMYVPSTLPEGSEAAEFSTDICIYSFDTNDFDNSKNQYADTATITFKSGDPALKDALYITSKTDKVREDGSDEWTEREVLILNVDNDVLKAPGNAIFHLSAESRDLTLEKDIPLHVLSWEDYPLFVSQEYSQPVTVSIGQEINYRMAENLAVEQYYDHIIADMFEGSSGREIGCEFINDESGALEEVGYNTSQVVKSGTWDMVFTFSHYNILIRVPVPMRALPYRIEGPKSIQPGKTAEYRIEEEEPGSGRSFTWSLEGEGVSLDAETGKVTASEDATGSEYTLTAVPSDGGDPAELFGSVGSGVLAGMKLRQDGGCRKGFYAVRPVDSPELSSMFYMNDDIRWDSTDAIEGYRVELDFSSVEEYTKSYEDPDAARQLYDQNIGPDPDVTVDVNEEIMLDGGHPARIIITRPAREETGYGSFCSRGTLLYAREEKMMTTTLTVSLMGSAVPENLPQVGRDDMIRIARKIGYDPAQASASLMGCKMSLAVKEGTTVVTAGKKLTFIPVYTGGEEEIRNAAKATVEWTVTGPDGAEAPAGVSISKGVLETGKADTAEKVIVTAKSAACKDPVSCEVTIIPAVKKLSVEPAELVFYTGTDTAAEVKAVLDPDTVPPLGITWTPVKAGIAEIIPNEENGTASVRPLSGGKTTVAVKEPGGKNATLTVSVVDPVEDIELKVSGKTTPGGTVTVKETILPKQAGNKNVEWTLDVGEDIATVSKGKVKIAKDAPVGTVITVTCTAVGAPEPVVRTVQIEVTEK